MVDAETAALLRTARIAAFKRDWAAQRFDVAGDEEAYAERYADKYVDDDSGLVSLKKRDAALALLAEAGPVLLRVATLLRQAFLDCAGLPPSPAAFEAMLEYRALSDAALALLAKLDAAPKAP